MFRDQKNINIRVLGWLLVAIFASNMHYLCYFIDLDVLHIDLKLTLLGREWIIKDVFPMYNAPKGAILGIQNYLFFVGTRIAHAILAYLLLSAIGALSTLMRITVRGFDIYRRVYFFTKVYLFVQLYNLLAYLLFGGQFLHGLPMLVYIGCVAAIFFVRRSGGKWEFRAEI